MRRLFVLAGAAIIAIAVGWRPLVAWWYLDAGNLAFVRGADSAASADFARGLALEPAWHSLLEDSARAMLDSDPSTALAELRLADCGEPCLAEAGDAQSRLGHAQAAVDDYLAAHAVERVGAAVGRLSDEGRYDEAIALERALAVRLGSGMLAEADLGSAYFTIGTLDAQAVHHGGGRSRAYAQDAIRSFRRASQLAPFNEDYLLSLGFADVDWGDRRAAKTVFERVLDLHPHEADAERGLAILDTRTPGRR
jgi:tetratricopeptide (TPR) repeat protein